ncbi:Helix-turn-helix protein [Thioflavicoccus mobilis 8321]|uniref:Helix-turn-helix protein n=1 Tax=Thioflavicoccus mobilis 8321 TaxID=765912 RepID=L0GXW4_9GAMM|nr:helix-turn-helix transcriptional regulator [Thioflavicoccus mobilis]AGA90220.1 Helix-turn-helix protein [Thioflavicoccus mobilis 8321]
MPNTEQGLTQRIGLRLRTARHDQGLSLMQLSERTSGALSKSRISNYEQGIRRMGLEEAKTLAAALGSVTPGYLLCLDDNGLLSEQERTLLRHFRAVDARSRKSLLKNAAELASTTVKAAG